MSLNINNVSGLGTVLGGLSPVIGASGLLGTSGRIQDIGDVNVLLGLASRTKDSLARTALLYAEMMAISAAFVGLSKASKSKGDVQIKRDQQQTEKISQQYVSEAKSKKQKDFQVVTDKITKQNPSELFAEVETKVGDYMKNEKPDDSKYNIARNDKDEDRGINYGYTDPAKNANSIDDGISSTQMPFPIFGQPFDNMSKTISENMTNLTEFDTYNSFEDKKDGLNGVTKLFKGWAIQDKTTGKMKPDPIRTFTQETPFSQMISDNMKNSLKEESKQPPGSLKFFIEKLHGRYADGSPYKKGKVESQYEIESPNNYTNRMVFPAYIDSFSDSYQSQWNSYSFIGRGEDVPIYKSTKRSMSVSFNVIADYSIDLMSAMETVYNRLNANSNMEDQLSGVLNSKTDYGLGYIGAPGRDDNGNQTGAHVPGKFSDTTETLWEKITFLAQCVYPYYRSDGKMKEQPMIRLRLGDFYDVTGYIDSLSYDTSEWDNVMDLNPSAIGAIPFGVKVTISMSIFHDNEPASNFYGFYHRKEFDNGSMNPIDGENIATIGSKGIVAMGAKKASPLDFTSIFKEGKMTDSPSILQNGLGGIFKKAVTDFSSKFAELNVMGINIGDAVRKVKMTNAMLAYNRVTEVANQLGEQYGLSQITKPNGMPQSLAQFTNTVKSGNLNTITNGFGSIVDKVSMNTINNKTKFDRLYGNTPSGPNSVKQAGVAKINRDILRESYNNAVNQVNSHNAQPKTFGDILANIKNNG